MFVDQATWEKLNEDSREMNLAPERVRLPRPEHLVALELHAIASATRNKKEVDWEDIRQLVRICQLDPNDELFRALILRYGDDTALQKIRGFHEQK